MAVMQPGAEEKRNPFCLEEQPELLSPRQKHAAGTRWAAAYIICGLIGVLVGACSARLRTNGLSCLLFGVLCLGFGLYTAAKTRELTRKTAEELSFTHRVESWFLNSYSAGELDRLLKEGHFRTREQASGEAPAPASEEWMRARCALIRSYITGEFYLKDETYIRALTESLYQKLYNNGKESFYASQAESSVFQSHGDHADRHEDRSGNIAG